MAETTVIYSDHPRQFPSRSNERRSFLVTHDTLFDGTKVGKQGSRQYILDDNHKPISRGYHEIRSLGCGIYIGKHGASKIVFANPAVVASLIPLMYRFIQILLEVLTLVHHERLPLP